MDKAAISGDIIAYTSLSNEDKTKIVGATRQLLEKLSTQYQVFGRLIKGDYIECYLPDPSMALRIALVIKSYLKSLSIDLSDSTDNRINAFKTHGIRLAIGIGEIDHFDPSEGIIDGEAIYFSGRMINDGRNTSDKERIVIKNTLFFKSNNEELNEEFEPLLALIDVLISKATAKQCNILYLKLMGNNEEAIANQLALNQSTVNVHSTSLGWNAIEKAVNHFEKKIKSQTETV
jgi:hypothetical protein